MNTTTRWITLAAGLLGFTGVALGAFGAHALKDTLIVQGTLETWKTGVLYQLVHAVALLALAGWGDSLIGSGNKIALCWIAGAVLFSGSLYVLALGGPRFFGPITPLGGVALLIGWAWLIVTAWKKPAA